MVPASKPPPLPRIIDGGLVYTVKRLLNVRKRGRGQQFLVDREGYGPEERERIPSSFIVDQDLIKDFYKSHPELSGPSGAVRKGGGTVVSRHLC